MVQVRWPRLLPRPQARQSAEAFLQCLAAKIPESLKGTGWDFAADASAAALQRSGGREWDTAADAAVVVAHSDDGGQGSVNGHDGSRRGQAGDSSSERWHDAGSAARAATGAAAVEGVGAQEWEVWRGGDLAAEVWDGGSGQGGQAQAGCSQDGVAEGFVAYGSQGEAAQYLGAVATAALEGLAVGGTRQRGTKSQTPSWLEPCLMVLLCHDRCGVQRWEGRRGQKCWEGAGGGGPVLRQKRSFVSNSFAAQAYLSRWVLSTCLLAVSCTCRF